MHLVTVLITKEDETRTFSPLRVIESKHEWDGYDVLVGRDIIPYGLLQMKGNWFSFSLPPDRETAL